MNVVFDDYRVCEDVADKICLHLHSSKLKEVHEEMCFGEGGRTGQYSYDISANGHWFNWWYRSRWYGQPGYGAWVAIVGGRFKE